MWVVVALQTAHCSLQGGGVCDPNDSDRRGVAAVRTPPGSGIQFKLSRHETVSVCPVLERTGLGLDEKAKGFKCVSVFFYLFWQ